MVDRGTFPEGTGSAASDSTSSSLLERVKVHDPEAWQRLCALYGPLIYRWCRQVGLQQADAADVSQEVFRTVANRIAEFEIGRPGGFRTWLRTITRNKIGDHLRRERQELRGRGGTTAHNGLHQVEASPDDVSNVDGEVHDNLLPHRALNLVRSEFADRSWQAFWLVVAEHRSPAEVAQQLDMTLAAVYMAKSRVLARLRQELDGPAT
jgi:RNA polymerase sigma-70 factor (ECF subfamily)